MSSDVKVPMRLVVVLAVLVPSTAVAEIPATLAVLVPATAEIPATVHHELPATPANVVFELRVGAAQVYWEAWLYLRNDPWSIGSTSSGWIDQIQVSGTIRLRLAQWSPDLAIAPCPTFDGEKTVPGFLISGRF